LDFDIDDNNNWYDAISDNVNHSELFDAFGNYKGGTAGLEVSSANTWFNTVTPDQYAMVQLEEATIICSEHAYRVHHFDRDDFDAVFLVNDTKFVDATVPVTAEDDDAHSDQDMSNTEADTDNDDNADVGGRIFKVQDPDCDKLRPLFGWMNTKTIKKTLEQTTQYARMPNDTILRKHYKSPFPALNVQRCDEPVATDTVYSNTPAIDGSETCAQIFVSTETLVTDVYGIKTEQQCVNALKDNIHERGAWLNF
jgi:hypothetical protein